MLVVLKIPGLKVSVYAECTNTAKGMAYRIGQPCIKIKPVSTLDVNVINHPLATIYNEVNQFSVVPVLYTNHDTMWLEFESVSEHTNIVGTYSIMNGVKVLKKYLNIKYFNKPVILPPEIANTAFEKFKKGDVVNIVINSERSLHGTVANAMPDGYAINIDSVYLDKTAIVDGLSYIPPLKDTVKLSVVSELDKNNYRVVPLAQPAKYMVYLYHSYFKMCNYINGQTPMLCYDNTRNVFVDDKVQHLMLKLNMHLEKHKAIAAKYGIALVDDGTTVRFCK